MENLDLSKTEIYALLSNAVLAQMHNELQAQMRAISGPKKTALSHQLFLINRAITLKNNHAHIN